MAHELLDMIKLDRTDRSILGAFACNCRITNATLAKALKVSKDTISYRIARLETSGLIDRYMLFIDARTLGFTRYHLLVRCGTISDSNTRMFSAISKHPNVMWVNSFVGKFDMQIIVDARTPFEFDRIRNELFAVCDSPVQDYTVLTHLYDLEFTQALPETNYKPPKGSDDGSFSHVLSTKRFPVSSSFEIASLDSLDRRILRALCENPRSPLTELERTLNRDRLTIRRRILQLIQKKVIINFGAVTSESKLGYVTYYLLVRHAQNIPEKVLQQTFENLDCVFYAGRMTGNYDMILYLNAKNPSELNQNIALFRQSMSKYIIAYDLLVQDRLHHWRQFTTGIEKTIE